GEWDLHMKSAVRHQDFKHRAGKPITNERTCPYHVGIPVAAAGLDVAHSRQIMQFHKSRDIQLRHVRTNFRYGEIYYRWCFPDLRTGRDFQEQFGGILWEPFFELT